MEQALLIIATVIVLVVAAYFADKDTRVKATTSVKNADQPIAKTLGQLAPEVTFKDLDGTDATLAKYRGKVVLVNFWATWCDPCYIEIPWPIEMQQKYESRGFTVLGIAMDDEGKSAVAPFL